MNETTKELERSTQAAIRKFWKDNGLIHASISKPKWDALDALIRADERARVLASDAHEDGSALRSENQALRKAMERIAKALGYTEPLLVWALCKDNENPAEMVARNVEERLAKADALAVAAKGNTA